MTRRMTSDMRKAFVLGELLIHHSGAPLTDDVGHMEFDDDETQLPAGVEAGMPPLSRSEERALVRDSAAGFLPSQNPTKTSHEATRRPLVVDGPNPGAVLGPMLNVCYVIIDEHAFVPFRTQTPVYSKPFSEERSTILMSPVRGVAGESEFAHAGVNEACTGLASEETSEFGAGFSERGEDIGYLGWIRCRKIVADGDGR
ncbi:hypothetical protein F5878DRAFT_667405 [Lentinula raphanica]|uniref:Uncharacterized protein n=1 Tax=Lentinula raphanica TaxID=153919 RepID=A0AA38U4R9_9AGAR|nr:hypothetical protein F5878DRAFT_667405 [Lentinula raphanica]